MKKGVLLFIFFLLSGYAFFSVKTIEAASLTSVSNTITTSRPSASAPLNANQAASATQVTIVDNGSIYLASDSATFRQDTGETIDTGKNVASTSAAISGTRIIYFSNTVTNTHHKGDPVVVPVSAMHTISFRTISAVPTLGTITIAFPTLLANDSNNTASPSASTFQFNGLSDTNVKINGTSGANTFTGTYTNPTAGTSPTIQIALTGTTTIAASTTVTILLGCSSATGAACNTQIPTIINPTKTAAAGTADTWTMNITTRDVTNSTDLDTSRIKIGTIESVQVRASVDPTLTFSIAGIANNVAVNTGNTTGCTGLDTTNAGNASTATVIDLGTLGNTPTATGARVSNIAAQLLTVTTNASNGYSLTATSSGQLINPANGVAINSNTAPAVFPNGAPWFGIHPCGLDVTAATWNTTTQACNTYITGSADPICKYAWPTSATSVSLASDTSGPIGNTIVTGNGLTTVEYAAGIDASIPSGIYTTVITYVATPTF